MNSGGKTLSCVTFELPSASYGSSINNYTSPVRYGEEVTGGKKYYVSGAPYLSNVSFVPGSTPGRFRRIYGLHLKRYQLRRQDQDHRQRNIRWCRLL